LAEFVYGNSEDKDLLEEAVRWVIVLIIFVFDPLAVLLLIASQYTFEFRKENKERLRIEQERKDYEQAKSELIIKNNGQPITETTSLSEDTETAVDEDIIERIQYLENLENTEPYKIGKMKWKQENPDQSIKFWKEQYIKGKVNELPWEGYVQNAEQGSNSIWNRIRLKDE
jgi:hypothetical protein